MKTKQVEIKIEKIIESGEGLGYFEEIPVLVYGVLPGERVLVEIFKKKAGKAKARLLAVLEAMEGRQVPLDEHFESCGPWQMMPILQQRELKKSLIRGYFSYEAGISWNGELVLETSNSDWNYRNKMEFSFAFDAENKLALALHKRGGHCGYHTLDHCALAHERINEAGKIIMDWLRPYNFTFRELKSLILRYSFNDDRVLVDLFVKDREIEMDLKTLLLPKETTSPQPSPVQERGQSAAEEIITGLRIIYSDHRSPASVTTEVLSAVGEKYLTESVAGRLFHYGPESFFQSNPPAFEKLIAYLRENIEDDERLVDLYAGVGVIGFCLVDKFKSIVSLEFNAEASAFARENGELNDLKNVEIICGEAEKADLENIIKADDMLLIDPPRSGLHPKAIKKILLAAPKKIVYVSCNPYTQARDLQVLKENYEIKTWRLFDFYPQTPHCESVMILTRKN